MILKEVSVVGHGNKTYCKPNKTFDELPDGNTKYTKRLGFKVSEKEKTLPIM